jgi:hypothetical protein
MTKEAKTTTTPTDTRNERVHRQACNRFSGSVVRLGQKASGTLVDFLLAGRGITGFAQTEMRARFPGGFPLEGV